MNDFIISVIYEPFYQSCAFTFHFTLQFIDYFHNDNFPYDDNYVIFLR